MRLLGGVLLVLALTLATTLAAEESCTGRCSSFDPMKKCQCDPMCVYYDSCCKDFESVCPKKARGDTFETPFVTTNEPNLELETSDPPTTTVLPPSTTLKPAPTARPDPDAVPCSARPFDAFLQLKNGSIYAFRGDYFFEMDERAVVPGDPKLIKDVWGISGPIDAAFTRINCQGKTYIFKGSQYWRFEDDVLDEDYPRDISVGFEKVPDYVSAAFAIPAPSHHGKEKVYFFKGEQYYQYEFKHQPSHEECVRMTRSSPSAQFTHYTDLYCDNWGDLFTQLFGGAGAVQGHKGPRFISKDWVGIRPPIDAAMVGRLYIGPKPTSTPAIVPAPGRRRTNRRRRPSRRRGHGGRSRHSRTLSFFEELFGDDYLLGDYDYGADYFSSPADNKAKPVQNVYFFKRDQYYRVDLQTKRIDFATPPYPRSIAKYWLGCEHEETTMPDDTLAEKK